MVERLKFKRLADEALASEEVAKSEETPAVDVVEEVTEVSKSDEAVVDSVAEIKNTLESAFSDLVSTVKSLQAEVEMLKSSKVDVELLQIQWYSRVILWKTKKQLIH